MSCTTCLHLMRKTRIDETHYEIVCDCVEYEIMIVDLKELMMKCDDWEAKECKQTEQSKP